jgi:hypothetical protein
MGGGHGHEEGIATDTEGVEGNGAPPESVPDMYKAFDGSALMAIGTPSFADSTLKVKRAVYQACCSKNTSGRA